MNQRQYARHATTRTLTRPERRENPGVETEARPGFGLGEKITLRNEVPGYGGAPLSAVLVEGPAENGSGKVPADAKLKIRVPGYGRRVIGVRLSPRNGESVPGDTGRLRLAVPGYGGVTLKTNFGGAGVSAGGRTGAGASGR
ncbi:hypothetical protein GBA65_10475 [Rubrobacter marinus]|uniref:Uncharacterized protein n=1 Tax=Rubrobacter marinus TaxID=2653852 RepID=A0A6G8PXG2_9ACTN|nr:hypothetical protein [Rubrobacter marinus]QIN78875.1 hypothetical protein GBA65_10475 [Rubrobacter marinus]